MAGPGCLQRSIRNSCGSCLGPAGKARCQSVWFFHGFCKTIVIAGEMESLGLFILLFIYLFFLPFCGWDFSISERNNVLSYMWSFFSLFNNYV